MATTITDVKVILTAPEGINLLVVKVETSQPGLVGLGCGTFAYRHLAVKCLVEEYLRPLLIGRDAEAIEAAVAGCGVALVRATDMDAAVLEANARAQAGDVVLLSPACASLDMFRNYAHRAQVFIDAVQRLPSVSLV